MKANGARAVQHKSTPTAAASRAAPAAPDNDASGPAEGAGKVGGKVVGKPRIASAAPPDATPPHEQRPARKTAATPAATAKPAIAKPVTAKPEAIRPDTAPTRTGPAATARPAATAPRAASPAPQPAAPVRPAAKTSEVQTLNSLTAQAPTLSATPDDTAPEAASPNPVTPDTVTPSPVVATPATPTPVAPTPVAATPVAPSVAAPEVVAPRLSVPQGPNGRPAPISRASNKDETFSEGDFVVYPTHGVGRVEKIASEDIAGHKLELIHITFEENRMTLRVPVSKARSAGLRRLSTRKLFDDALAVLKGRARIKRTMWSRRAQEYEAKINSGDPVSIAEVVRDLHRNAGQPDQSFSERQIYEAAMDRLAAELGALDLTDKNTAITKLIGLLKPV